MTTSSHDSPLPPGSAEIALDPRLLERYWLREALPAEVQAVDAWFASHPAERVWYDQLRQGIVAGTPLETVPIDVQAVIASVQQRIERPAGVLRASSSPWQQRLPAQGWWRGVLAASLALAAVATGWRIIASRGDSAGQTHTFATRAGERGTLVLADGSRVMLAPHTVVNVQGGYGAATRALSLQGEAYFDVVPVAAAPFTVTSGTVETRVLGTTFSVAYRTGQREQHTDDVHVLVETGKVSVEGSTGVPAIVSAGQAAVARDSVVVADTVRRTVSVEWETGRLQFDRASLGDALETLSRWYSVEFLVADPALAHYRVSGTLPYGSTADMLVTLRNLLGVSLSIDTKRKTPLVVLRSAGASVEKRSRAVDSLPLSTARGR